MLLNNESKGRQYFNSYWILVWLWTTRTLQRELWEPFASTVSTQLHDQRSDTRTLSALGSNWCRSSHGVVFLVWRFTCFQIHLLFTQRFFVGFWRCLLRASRFLLFSMSSTFSCLMVSKSWYKWRFHCYSPVRRIFWQRILRQPLSSSGFLYRKSSVQVRSSNY